jgi:predicted transcriptional regulator
LEKVPRRKRTRYELLADLLQCSKGGARKTALMYRANLSHELLNKYLAFLMKNRFLERRGVYFFPSQRGIIYLQRFANYQRNKNRTVRSEEKIESILPPVKGGSNSRRRTADWPGQRR